MVPSQYSQSARCEAFQIMMEYKRDTGALIIGTSSNLIDVFLVECRLREPVLLIRHATVTKNASCPTLEVGKVDMR
jgi:hypothetical protein